MTSRRRTSRRLRSNARRAASRTKAAAAAAKKGYWRITVKGKAIARKFRSSAKLLAYAKEKYGNKFKWGWKAN
jgi:hypothetical protein